jgi:hypothetical protein
MSSATSIDSATAKAVPKKDAPAREDAQPGQAIRPWHFFVLASLIAATAAVIMARQSRPEHLVLISLTVGAAGFAAGALYRTLVPLVGKDARPIGGPLPESMRAVLDREKSLVLRSIKELEFDRAMGKVSARDFDEMATRLRLRAMSLMRQLDASSGYRELIERELSARLRRPGLVGAKEVAVPPGDRATHTQTCTCGTANDADAAFCKRCGTRLRTS